MLSRRQKYRFRTIIAVLCVVFCWYCLASLKSASTLGSDLVYRTSRSPESVVNLIVPASQVESTLCKTLVSAAVLDYPSPHLVNLGLTFNIPGQSHGGSHLAKIPGILARLNGYTPDKQAEIVLVVDGLDTWFQLGPSVLLGRYYRILQRTSEHLSQSLCGTFACMNRPERTHINPQIVFSAQKRCWPAGQGTFTCLAPLANLLPEEISERNIDAIGLEMNGSDPNIKPRFLNSGFVIGPVSQMKHLFKEAARRAKKDSHRGSDQAIFAEIYAEQEYGRYLLRNISAEKQSIFQTTRQNLYKVKRRSNGDGMLTTAEGRPEVDVRDAKAIRSLEYGITLDYSSTLSQTTVFAHRDADWIRHDRLDLPSKHWQTIPPDGTRFEIPQDMLDTAAEHNVTDWSHMQLFTNLYAGIVPVSIHHNAWQDGMKSHLWTTWRNMWWYDRSVSITRPAKIEQSKALDDHAGNFRSLHGEDASRSSHEVSLDNGTRISLAELCREQYPLFELDVHI